MTTESITDLCARLAGDHAEERWEDAEGNVFSVCVEDQQDWPCDKRRVLDELERLKDELKRTNERVVPAELVRRWLASEEQHKQTDISLAQTINTALALEAERDAALSRAEQAERAIRRLEQERLHEYSEKFAHFSNFEDCITCRAALSPDAGEQADD